MKDNKRLVRTLVPIIVVAMALGVVASMVFGPKTNKTPPPDETTAAVVGTDGAESPEPAGPADGDGEDATNPDDVVAAEDQEPVTPVDPVAMDDLHVRAVDPATATPLGSLDPGQAEVFVEMTTVGAGIERITFSDIWETARAKQAALAYREAIAAGKTDLPEPPDETMRYVLTEAQPFSWIEPISGETRTIQVPVLAAHSVTLNGTKVDLVTAEWAQTAPGVFEIELENGQGELVARLRRSFTLAGDFRVDLDQSVENLSGAPLTVEWVQYGPDSLTVDRARYMDRRRFRFGFELSLAKDPNRLAEVDAGLKQMLELRDVVKADDPQLWPSRRAIKEDYRLSWFASVNRYFAVVVMPPVEDGQVVDRSLIDTVDRITKGVSGYEDANGKVQDIVFTALWSPQRTVAPGATTSFDQSLFAGPQDRHILHEAPYSSLSLQELILYQMSSCCAICTFQWLAKLLLVFLGFLRFSLVGDWGVAIILLVICVRALLHPITKRSQINMQRFGKAMQAMKPEMDRLQKKYKDDAKKLQAEQLRLMKEHGTSPAQMFGCLPMFLQTPIWIALYAMLYFVYDLRHEPAFYGIFQNLTNGSWRFLADLSSGDHFFGELAEPTKFLMWNITGINLLPILMGFMFFFQQKYLSPPTSATLSPEQAQQQKLMKIMTVVLFPLMLYSAPSGLTLYILTSSTIGILEGAYVRKHITDADLKPKKADPKKQRRRDAMGKAYGKMLARRKAAAKAKAAGPAPKYKKRK